MPRRTRPAPAAALPIALAARPAPPPSARWAIETGHDLRQSLQAATVQAHALVLQAQQQARPDWVQLGQQMAQALQHCHGLLEALLASLQGGPPATAAVAPTPDWQDVDLGPLLDAVLLAWQPVAAQRGLQLSLHRPATSPRVRSDALLLRRVLDNLVGNALAHTPAGAVRLQLWPAADPACGGPVLSVSDTGPGLAPGPGGTPAGGTLASTPGHGLGLLIVQSLCALLGIQVDWQAGAACGTVARLAWPAAPAGP